MCGPASRHQDCQQTQRSKEKGLEQSRFSLSTLKGANPVNTPIAGSGLQNGEPTHFCCLGRLVAGTVLQKPQKAHGEGKAGVDHVITADVYFQMEKESHCLQVKA